MTPPAFFQELKALTLTEARKNPLKPPPDQKLSPRREGGRLGVLAAIDDRGNIGKQLRGGQTLKTVATKTVFMKTERAGVGSRTIYNCQHVPQV